MTCLHTLIGREVSPAFDAALNLYVRDYPTPEAERAASGTVLFERLDAMLWMLAALCVEGTRASAGLPTQTKQSETQARKVVRDAVAVARLRRDLAAL